MKSRWESPAVASRPVGGDFSDLFSPACAGHCRRGVVHPSDLSASTSLCPFAPRTLLRFPATMDTLTSARRANPSLPVQISLLHGSGRCHRSVSNHPTGPRHGFDTLPLSLMGGSRFTGTPSFTFP